MADDNPSMLLTNAGAALLARVMAGETLTFTRGAFGDSFQNGQIVLPTTDEQAQMEHLINERIELPLIKINPTGAYAEIDMQVESAKVDNSFMISEIGLFAKIGDEQEKLYGYFNAGLKGDYMPASHSAIAKDYVYTVIVVIGNAQNVTAIINKNDYELPTASTTQKGGIKIGNGLYMSGDSLNASAQTYTLPTASTSTKGGVKIGTGLSMNGEVLNANTYTLPTASTSTKGGVKIGSGLSMDGETLNATVSGGLSNPIEGSLSILSGNGKYGELVIGGGTQGGGLLIVDESTENSIGGTIFLNGVQSGGSLIMTGASDKSGGGGTIDLTGGIAGGLIRLDSALGNGGTLQAIGKKRGGTVDLSGENGSGGLINLSGVDSSSGGSIKGNPHFTDKVFFDGGAEGIELPIASATLIGAVKVGKGLYMRGASLHASAQELQTATASVLGGIKIGDEFKAPSGELRLSGKVNSDLSLQSGNGFSVSSGEVLFQSNSHVSLDNSRLYLADSTVSGSAHIYLPQAEIELGSDETPLTLLADNSSIDLSNASIKAANLTLKGSDVSSNAIVIDGKTSFTKTVSINAGLRGGLNIAPQAEVTVGAGSLFYFGNNSSIDASKDSVNISDATIVGSNSTSIQGNIHFTGKPVFENGVSGIDGSYTLPTASTSTKGGIKVGTGLSMNGDTLNVTATGGLTNPVEGTLTIKSGSAGGTLDLSAASANSNGGTINLTSGQAQAGKINMHGATKGGVIDLSSDSTANPGEIQGCPRFTSGLQIGTNTITQMKIQNGSLVITVDGTTLTLGGVTLSTVASNAQGSMWMSSV